MRWWPLPLLLVFFGSAQALARGNSASSARIVTDDVARFWKVFDRTTPKFPAKDFDKQYLARGSQGLKDFTKLRIGDADKLAATVRSRPRYYASVRAHTLRIRSMEGRIRSSFHALEKLYPEAVFPNVYFVIGRMSAVGTVSEHGLLLGAEMFGLTPETPFDELEDWHREALQRFEDIPYVVAHELVHFQQPEAPEKTTLLASALDEGAADFVAELISGRHLNAHLHTFGNARERELWEEFRQKMRGEDVSGWLYETAPGRPTNLGYWMGYRIVQAYYERSTDKRAALRQILHLRDPEAFLAASGYAERFRDRAAGEP
ncbi:DUF2268 domain-containing putative Zn-dependent protease [Archangium violaceum]|uniref:gliding motility protein GldB-related protein n=1 Tax=Archangium violaceum TaxID=83451 RepID=UPI0006979672|nr:DUF2268 domain-containing putative Zn-dependent protease [Archangium violaceum]